MNNKEKVKEHYNVVSEYYYALWGKHVHHGYWMSGDETKEEAQVKLIELLIDLAEIEETQKILDVGCGIGGSSVYLAKHLNADVTGITISSAQVEIANKLARDEGVRVDFKLMDADNIELDKEFDVVWSVEAISHFDNQKNFFKNVSKNIRPGGKIALIDWFQEDGLSEEKIRKYIEPIKIGMFVPNMTTMNDYKKFLEEAGFKIKLEKDISENVSRTWDICLDIIKKPELWKLAVKHGKDFIDFLKAFKAMRDGFKSKTFVYGLIVAEKTS